MRSSKEFCAHIKYALDNKFGYVWGEDGDQVYTKAIAEKYKKNKRKPPSGNSYNTYWTVRCAKWFGRVCVDCSGLIVYALREIGAFSKKQDMNSSGLMGACKKWGYIKDGNIPNVDGIILWRSGHIAILYKGKVLESKGTDYGVVYGVSAINKFTKWGYLPWLDYGEIEDPIAPETKDFLDATCTGNSVNIRQKATTSSKSLGKLNKGNKLKAKKPVGDWCEVIIGSISGFMHKNYVKF